MKRLTRNSVDRQAGFTLVELAVVIIVIGVLAAFAVPRFRDSVERSKASEAFNYLSSVRAAQERFAARQGTYSDDLTRLDIALTDPQYFSVGGVEAGVTSSLEDSWSLTLTRMGASAGYGDYTVTFTEDGFDVDNSSISTLESINPMQTSGAAPAVS